MTKPAKDKLIIFDTTLRDGEQSPGVTLTGSEKVEIARQLSRLGVDVCEAGFPIASQGDFEAVERIAKEVGPLNLGRASGKPMVICGLARAVPADIQRAYDAIHHAPHHRIHTFLATSDIHLEHKLRITRDECVARAVAAVKFAKSLGCNDIEFSPEDAGRSDVDFLCRVLGEVIKAGATTLNIPDTVGYNTPEEYGSMIKHLVRNVPGGDNVTWSTHCHNDLGLATANTLAGIVNGARQVEVTINGIGERAGNTSLEEIVMAIYTHPSTYPVHTTIDTYQIYHTSQLVTKKTGMPIQPNKAIVGANAFAHESGIHQDGVLKHKQTYEIIEPAVVGIPSNVLVLGKHSGRNALRSRLTQLTKDTVYEDVLKRNAAVFERLFVAFKKLADTKKKGVTDTDLYALLDDQMNASDSGFETFVFKACQVVSTSGVLATATITLVDKTVSPRATSITSLSASEPEDQNGTTPTETDANPGVERCDAAIGHGPVHAIFNAINRIIERTNVLASYEVKAVTEGSDALGRVLVRIQEAAPTPTSSSSPTADAPPPRFHDPVDSTANLPYEQQAETFQGQGTDEDILVASAKAYVNAVNKMVDAQARRAKSGTKDVNGTDGAPASRKVDV
ncbi:2-isopropylmalate synthase [Fimicolochytrium jonesii]|uniref:2-isopropylmalate synthase n=1 Tax=Fimicolochytrium jonesii TaxID=1396493 RepID=UPI0022FEA9F3|nr:2-isopropylmalate synthase [Fimicolochytrium jonesii]KAI8821841.1 2-isopropylmalate synthase [Fimicolochytrium jonesii]